MHLYVRPRTFSNYAPSPSTVYPNRLDPRRPKTKYPYCTAHRVDPNSLGHLLIAPHTASLVAGLVGSLQLSNANRIRSEPLVLRPPILHHPHRGSNVNLVDIVVRQATFTTHHPFPTN